MKLLAINCNPDFSFFKERGLNLSVTSVFDETKFKLKSLYKVKNSSGKMVDLYTPDVEAYIENKYQDKGWDVIMVGYNPDNYGTEIKNTGGYTYPNKLKNGARLATVRVDRRPINNHPVHEMMHVLGNIINVDFQDFSPKDFMDNTPVGDPVVWKSYYKNDYTLKDKDSSFNQTWNNYKPFLSKLNAIGMDKYKYFSEKEIVGLKPELVQKLVKARGIAGIPFFLTSVYRTPEHNKKVGGVEDSSHTTGLAVDILIKDGVSGGKILLALVEAGFKRFGFYQDGHLHTDIDDSKPKPCYWNK